MRTKINMRSQIFYTDAYKEIQEKTKNLLNNQSDFLSAQTAGSTRAVGDAVQDILGDGFQSVLGDLTDSYSAEFARRAMADIAFERNSLRSPILLPNDRYAFAIVSFLSFGL